MSDCVFCDIVANRVKVEELMVHDDVISFIPLNPVTDGHRLFVPKTHAKDAADSPIGAARAICEAGYYGRVRGEDFNLITSKGAAATQTIFHTHIHYVPRREGDGLMLPWTEHFCL